MSEETSIQVNFGRPTALFPLEAVTLLPQQLLPLHIFEERYRQMIDHALDGSGQIAMAILETSASALASHSPGAASGSSAEHPRKDSFGRPAIRPAVCVGQIVQHEKLFDGRYNLLIQGVCRARVVEELPPEEGRLYRMAMLEPVGLDPGTVVIGEDEDEGEEEEETPDLGLNLPPQEPAALSAVRERIGEMLSEGPLTQLVAAEPVLEFVRNQEVPVGPLLELVSFMLITDPALRYKLLAEPDMEARAGLIMGELEHLSHLIKRAGTQRPQDWPKGMSWN